MKKQPTNQLSDEQLAADVERLRSELENALRAAHDAGLRVSFEGGHARTIDVPEQPFLRIKLYREVTPQKGTES